MIEVISRRRIGLLLSGLLLSGLLVAAVFLQTAAAEIPAQDDHLIVPWKRIGPVALGMTTDEMIGAMGPPVSKWPGIVDVYNWHEVSATVTKDGLWATQVCTLNPAYATAEGVHPGSTDDSVTALLGPPKYSRLPWLVAVLLHQSLLAGADGERASQGLRHQPSGLEDLRQSFFRPRRIDMHAAPGLARIAPGEAGRLALFPSGRRIAVSATPASNPSSS